MSVVFGERGDRRSGPETYPHSALTEGSHAPFAATIRSDCSFQREAIHSCDRTVTWWACRNRDAFESRSELSSVHHVYVLECDDGSLYTGYTTDVERRVAEHDASDGAKYTRGRTPVQLVHVESFDCRSAAMSREYEIKQLSRLEKERLVFEEEIDRECD